MTIVDFEKAIDDLPYSIQMEEVFIGPDGEVRMFVGFHYGRFIVWRGDGKAFDVGHKPFDNVQVVLLLNSDGYIRKPEFDLGFVWEDDDMDTLRQVVSFLDEPSNISYYPETVARCKEWLKALPSKYKKERGL